MPNPMPMPWTEAKRTETDRTVVPEDPIDPPLADPDAADDGFDLYAAAAAEDEASDCG